MEPFAATQLHGNTELVSKQPQVMRLQDIALAQAEQLLARFAMKLTIVPEHAEIPGSYWGEDEAGLIGDIVYARLSTPLHSLLHEASHWITCSPARRAHLHTDAADNQDEENATCYLQILLADYLDGFGQARALADMDAWGYSFKLGSARAWFAQDAEAELAWLQQHGIVDGGRVLFKVRQ